MFQKVLTSGIPCVTSTGKKCAFENPELGMVTLKSYYVALSTGTKMYLVLKGMCKFIWKSVSSSQSQASRFHSRHNFWHKFILLLISLLASIVSLAERNNFVEASFKMTSLSMVNAFSFPWASVNCSRHSLYSNLRQQIKDHYLAQLLLLQFLWWAAACRKLWTRNHKWFSHLPQLYKSISNVNID